MRAVRVTVAAAIGAMTLVIGSPASAAPTGTERFTFVATSFTSDTESGKAVASGPVAGVGTFSTGPGDVFELTVHLPQGDLSLLESNASVADHLDEVGCVLTFSGTDTFVVTGGTGAFSGATGSGTDAYRGRLVYPRNANRTCNLDANPRGIVVVKSTVNLV